MSGLPILGICLVLIGLLTIGYGGATVGFSLSVDFQSFLVGGFIVVLIGAALIHMMPDLEFMLMLISDVVVLGFAAWFAILFLRK